MYILKAKPNETPKHKEKRLKRLGDLGERISQLEETKICFMIDATGALIRIGRGPDEYSQDLVRERQDGLSYPIQTSSIRGRTF